VISDREENVPSSTLRNAEFDEIEHRSGDGISGLLKGLRRVVHHVPGIVLHGWHVLDKDKSRKQHLSGSGGTQV
jgi:hypothetical protein